MATIPQVPTSTRRVGVLPQVQMYRSQWGEIGRTVGGAIGDVGRGIGAYRDYADTMLRVNARLKEIDDRKAEREAQYRASLANDFVQNRWNGSVVQNEDGTQTQIPGVVHKTWMEQDADRKNGVDYMTDIIDGKDGLKSQEFYTSMTPEVREKFDRIMQFNYSKYGRTAMAFNTSTNAARMKDQNAKMEDDLNRGLLSKEGGSTPEFAEESNYVALKKIAMRYGSAIENPQVLDSPYAEGENRRPVTLADLKLRGVPDDSPMYGRMKQDYDAFVREHGKNRITNLTRAASEARNLGTLSPEAALSEATNTIDEMRDGGQLTEAEISDLRGLVGKAKTLHDATVERRKTAAAAEAYGKQQEYIRDVELKLLDPAKVLSEPMDGYDVYEARLNADKLISTEQKQSLLKNYRSLMSYRDKYAESLRKHEQAVADKAEKERSEHGWIDEDGKFIPASSFPSKSDASAFQEFNRDSGVWQDPSKAMARLEAARMTGRLGEADYRKWREYGAMLMDDKAQTWWFKNYGKFSVEGLTAAEYGEDGVGRAAKTLRLKKGYSAASGIFASRPGVRKTYANASDFVADTLSKDTVKRGWFGSADAGTEDLVPPETLEKVYATVRRFARRGVDPADAMRAILQPALENGIKNDLEWRLSSNDYFNEVVNNFLLNGTHFTQTAADNAVRGVGTNWNMDVRRAATRDLVDQGRAKVSNGTSK